MTPAKSRRRKSGQDQVVEEPAKDVSKSTTESSREKKLPVRAKDEETAAPVKGTLKVFGDDDEEDDVEVLKVSSKTAAKKEEKEEEIEDSDDDEAPEAVSTTKAALDIKKSAQAAQRAAKDQEAAQKRKRQQRDELFKQQAEERKKVEAEAAAAAAAELQDEDGDDIAVTRQPEVTSGRRRMDKLRIPAVLPLEYLTDSSGESEDEGSASAHARPKRRKVSSVEKKLSRQDRGPRDEVVGSTVYRVTKKADERLTPKLRKYAKSSKDVLLKRNRSAVKPKSGFATKK